MAGWMDGKISLTFWDYVNLGSCMGQMGFGDLGEHYHWVHSEANRCTCCSGKRVEYMRLSSLGIKKEPPAIATTYIAFSQNKK